ncbi:MAG: type IV pilus biogenesis/stability protein PilW [Gammaproteobacteria bacterium]|nr:type IV pilus biogenesis/stability protein PilW [Gammaproteobacteria bacterium]
MTRHPASVLLAMLAVGMLAGACSSTGRQSDALKATEDRPDTLAETHVKLGMGYMQQGKPDIALGKLQRALELDPNLASGHNAIAILYDQLGRVDTAEEHYKRALALAPQDSSAHNNYGTFLCSRRNRLDEAEQEFLKALENPLYATPELAYENAGLCAQRKPDLVKAEQYFRRALELRQTLPVSLYQMALINFETGRHLPARAYLQRYAEVASHTPQSLWLGIRIERVLGDKDAVASYSVYLKGNFPDSDEAKLLQASEHSSVSPTLHHGRTG